MAKWRDGLVVKEGLRAQLEVVLDREAATIARYDARIDALEAERDALREALEDIAGVGFLAPMTWRGTDAEWERHRANAMQAAARDALIMVAKT